MHQSLISSREAAEILGVDPSTITRMVHRGQLEPASKAPGLRGAFMFDETLVESMAGASC
ncbi:hypothetical protein GMA5_20 [Gordonia phage GMA5]|uniref:Helix-turn-helix domain-containing protein n=1 Tax=Gordonia phage GMA5 TaxID=1647472 RepID=A0A0K0MWS9_9CAUD|nr:excisionase and transcriptional regulator [Gordonia phage GMA5]AKI28634.1 hypothetical protein GMA5_20 [Gordonia phage GMA5]